MSEQELQLNEWQINVLKLLTSKKGFRTYYDLNRGHIPNFTTIVLLPLVEHCLIQPIKALGHDRTGANWESDDWQFEITDEGRAVRAKIK